MNEELEEGTTKNFWVVVACEQKNEFREENFEISALLLRKKRNFIIKRDVGPLGPLEKFLNF